jgi:hypothetical protein
MLAHQNSESLNDLAYERGGMGHHGFQQSPAGTTVRLAGRGTAYGFEAGRIYLLDANDVIKASAFSGAHSDVRHPEVLWAVHEASR